MSEVSKWVHDIGAISSGESAAHFLNDFPETPEIMVKGKKRLKTQRDLPPQ